MDAKLRSKVAAFLVQAHDHAVANPLTGAGDHTEKDSFYTAGQ